MESVVLDGTKYVKASLLAKEFKYAPDYIGQLCRNKKVDAQLVGRSWYVNPDSLTSHKKNKYKQYVKKEEDKTESVFLTVRETSDTDSKNKPKRTIVPPALKSKTAKFSVPVTKFHPHKMKLSVSYEPDDEMLLPELHRKRTLPSHPIQVVPAEARQMHIAASKATSVFAATELPEVSLSGSLTVVDVPDGPTEEEKAEAREKEEALKNKAKTNKKELQQRFIQRVELVEKSHETVQKSVSQRMAPVVRIELAPSVQTLAIATKQPQKKILSTPASTSLSEEENEEAYIKEFKNQPLTQAAALKISQNTSEQLEQVTQDSQNYPSIPSFPIQQPVPASGLVAASPLIATVLALVGALVIFSASVEIIAGEDTTSRVLLQTANLLDLVVQ